ncbi:WG repeat-containing protein [Exiguobacterium sp. TNDT2]|uniref:WG repeat-containing protein n=1 Tax=Exiguobacterium sp. TNDT2 TaxID=2233531 RepID=UPI000DEF0976|nr:WG repeat-containing protein [Exiguobacterium sp. TNDT2]
MRKQNTFVFLFILFIAFGLLSPSTSFANSKKSVQATTSGHYILNEDGTVDHYSFKENSTLSLPKKTRLPFKNVRQITTDGYSIDVLQGNDIWTWETSTSQAIARNLNLQDVHSYTGQTILHNDQTVSIYVEEKVYNTREELTDIKQVIPHGDGAYLLKNDHSLWFADFSFIDWVGVTLTKEPIQNVQHLWSTYSGLFVKKTDGTVWQGISVNEDYIGEHQPLKYRQLKDFSNAIDFTSSYNQTIAVKADGSVWRWGYIGEREVNTPERMETPPVISVGLDDRMTIALTKDGDQLYWKSDGSRVLSANKKEILPVKLPTILYKPQFWNASWPSEGKMQVMTTYGEILLLDEYGQTTGKPKVTGCSFRIGAFNHGLVEVCTTNHKTIYGAIGLSDSTGRLIVSPNYRDLTVVTPKLVTYKTSNGRWGLMDLKRKTIFAPSSTIPIEFDGQSLAKVQTTEGKVGFINTSGKWVIPAKYTRGHYFGDGNVFVESKEKYGIMNARGKWVVTPRYEYVHGFGWGMPYKERKTITVTWNRKERLINTQGKELKASIVLNKLGYSIEGSLQHNRILVSKNGKYGFADQNGKIVVTPSYYGATEYSEHRAIVSKMVKGKRYDQMIDTNGKVISKSYQMIGQIAPGGVPFEDAHGKWGYLDLNGKVIVAATYDWVSNLEDGIGLIQNDERYGYIKVK